MRDARRRAGSRRGGLRHRRLRRDRRRHRPVLGPLPRPRDRAGAGRGRRHPAGAHRHRRRRGAPRARHVQAHPRPRSGRDPDRRLRRLPRHLRRRAHRLRPRGGVPERDRVDRRYRRRVPDPGGGDQVRPREVRDGGAHTSRAGGGAARLEPRHAAQDDRAQAVALPRHPPRRSGGLRHRGRPAGVPRPPPGRRPRRFEAGHRLPRTGPSPHPDRARSR